MGFESILVSFQGYAGTPEHLAQSLAKIIPTAWNPAAEMTSRSRCLVLDDGQHKLEVEVGPTPSVFSLRFALCNPRSIDRVFFHLIQSVVCDHRLTMRFCEDCDEVPEWFTSSEMIEQWNGPIQRCLDWRRQQWHQEFGDDELPATCAEAFREFILPRTLNDNTPSSPPSQPTAASHSPG